ncbi:MAG: hypothetical protein EAZ11_02535 [Curvibacter sp.]|nr:MAG: hypothetical protein EAZ11_02535 [Curvibacter sp.]
MSLFHWFGKKTPSPPVPAESSSLGHMDATQPFGHNSKSRASRGNSESGSAANRKHERLERRELLYTVVRESMTRAGLLSSSYKFKVLSLDSRGRQYLIMMDLARQNVVDPQRLADMESHIAKVAKSQHDILVTAVYWRINEHVTAGLARSSGLVEAAPPQKAAEASAPSRYEPLQPDEVAAFKQALAAAPSPATLSAPGEIVRTGRRNPAPPHFQDTELDERNSPLSGTQYGELH